MKLLTAFQRRRMLVNGRTPGADNVRPVVKLFTPDANCTWLLTELDPERPDYAFGLCDLGMGHPELGFVSLNELASARGPLGLRVERDRWFKPEKSLGAYADEARASGCLIA